MNIVKEVLLWLERVIPTFLAALGLGYKLGAKGKKKLEIDLLKSNMELEKKKNAEIIEKINRDLTAGDILKRSIERGRNLRKK